MKTSYFGRANSNAFKNSGLRFVSVARSCRYWHGESYPALFPTYEMIKMTDEKEYEKVLGGKNVVSSLSMSKNGGCQNNYFLTTLILALTISRILFR